MTESRIDLKLAASNAKKFLATLPDLIQPHSPCEAVVYVLIDRKSGDVVYVGQSTNPWRRYHEHLGPGGKWEHGPTPRMVAVGFLQDRRNGDALEDWWIGAMRLAGMPLKNFCGGNVRGEEEYEEVLREFADHNPVQESA